MSDLESLLCDLCAPCFGESPRIELSLDGSCWTATVHSDMEEIIVCESATPEAAIAKTKPWIEDWRMNRIDSMGGVCSRDHY